MTENQTVQIQKMKACNENWFQMQGNDRVRFCSHCAKHVHNLDQMTPENIQAITQSLNGPVCVRMVLPPLPRQQLTKSGSKLPKLLAGSWLLAGSMWAGQMGTHLTLDPGWVQTDNDSIASTRSHLDLTQGPHSVRGIVTEIRADEQGQQAKLAVSDMKVYLKDGCDQIIGQVWTDQQGQYEFSGIPLGRFSLEFDAGTESDREVLEFLSQEPKKSIRDVEIGTFWVGEVGISPDMVEAWLFNSRDFYQHQSGKCSKEEFGLADDSYRGLNEAFRVPKLVSMALEKKTKNSQLEPGDLDPNERDQYGNSWFLSVLVSGQFELAREYIKKGADVKGETSAHVPYLFYAARMGDPDLVQAMLNHGADPNATDKSGHTALMVAAYYGYPSVVDLLQKAGAQLDAKDINGLDAAFYAKQNCK
ncbi:MAG: ankyrin repeat domain-containing protein [Acidobacteria bacterium]|nr:ankyrin repeat domain-containing protein [Acidobacteriota bacterium]